MSSKCRDCGLPLEWAATPAGKRLPLDPDTKADHRDTCPNRPLERCRDCGGPVRWTSVNGRRRPLNPEGTPHRETCPRVADSLRSPKGHHVSASRLHAHDECNQRFYLERVLELPVVVSDDTVAKDSGKLGHAAVESAGVVRARTNNLAAFSAEELHGALDRVVAVERWSVESLAQARSVLATAAPKIDLSFAATDQHGPLLERKFSELALGDGVLAGGILDLVERYPSAVIVSDWKFGQLHNPDDHRVAAGFYGAVARSWFPGIEVRVLLHWLALDVEPTEFAGRQLDAAIGDARAAGLALVAKLMAKGNDPSAWPPTVGRACESCSFTSRCDAFQARRKALLDERAPELEPATLEEIAAELHRLDPLNAAANAVSNRVKKLRDAAKVLAAQVVQTRGGKDGRAFGEALVGGRWPIKLMTSPRAGYTVEATVVQTIKIGDPIEPAPSLERPATPEEHKTLTTTSGAGALAVANSEEPAPGAAQVTAPQILPTVADPVATQASGSSQEVHAAEAAPQRGVVEAPAGAGVSSGEQAPEVHAPAGEEPSKVPCYGCEKALVVTVDAEGCLELADPAALFDDLTLSSGELLEVAFCSPKCQASSQSEAREKREARVETEARDGGASPPGAEGGSCPPSASLSPDEDGGGCNAADLAVPVSPLDLEVARIKREEGEALAKRLPAAFPPAARAVVALVPATPPPSPEPAPAGIVLEVPTRPCAKCKKPSVDLQRTTVIRQMSSRCAIGADVELCPECREALAPERPEDPKESVGFGETALSWECPVCKKRFQNARGLGGHKRSCAGAPAKAGAP